MEDKDCLQVLVTEYGIVKTEMKTYIDLFHRSTNFVTVYASFLVAAGSLLFSVAARGDQVPEVLNIMMPFRFFPDVRLYQLLAFCGYLIVAMIGLSFVSATLSYIYVIEVLAARASIIERTINRLANRDLLAWEIAVSPQLIRKFLRKGVWISPSALRVTSNIAVLAIILFVEAFTATPVMGSRLGKVFTVLLTVAAAFFAVQGIAYRKVAIPLISKIAEHESAPSSLSRPHE